MNKIIYLLAFAVMVSCSWKNPNDDPSTGSLKVSWIYSESISPNSTEYEHDGINDFIKIKLHNSSSDSMVLVFKDPISGNIRIPFEKDTLVLAIRDKHKFLELLPNENKVLLARTIKVISSEKEDPTNSIRNVFEKGEALRLENIEIRSGANIFGTKLNFIKVYKSAEYLTKIE